MRRTFLRRTVSAPTRPDRFASFKINAFVRRSKARDVFDASFLLSRRPEAITDQDITRLGYYVDICGLRRHYLAADEEPGPGHRGGRDRPQHCAHDGAAAGAGPGRQVRPNRWHLGGPAVDQLILAPLLINVHSDKGESAPPPTGFV